MTTPNIADIRLQQLLESKMSLAKVAYDGYRTCRDGTVDWENLPHHEKMGWCQAVFRIETTIIMRREKPTASLGDLPIWTIG